MAHTITLVPSGHRFVVDDGQRILASGLAAGNYLPYSCRQGICSSCKARVVEGRVDYGDCHPAYFTAADRDAGYALLCQASPLSDCTVEVREVDGLAGVKPGILPCRVTDLTRLAHDVIKLRVRLPPNDYLRFIAGQYVDFLFDEGEGGLRRSYSIAVPHSVEGVRALEFHIRHLPGGRFTDRLFGGGVNVGEILRFEGPLGSFYLRDSTRPAVFIAGGTGLGPILAMLEVAAQRKDPRPLRLYWGCRSRRDLYLPELPPALFAQLPDFQYVPVLSDPLPDDHWQGRTGFVHRAVLEDLADLSGHQVYACGAPAMVEAARRDLVRERGLPDDEFFADSFLSAAQTEARAASPGDPQQAQGGAS